MHMPKQKKQRNPRLLIGSIVAVAALPAVLLGIRMIATDSSRYVFLYWNLILAAAAPLLAWWLVYRLRLHKWNEPEQVVLTFLWLIFLPNSFYIITDFIHLRETYEAPLMYDIALIMSFVMSGLIFGYTSVFMLHRELMKRLDLRYVWMVVSGVFLLVSFAIYLGRFSRWNTWDVLLAPAGLLFDVSERVVNPAAHLETYISTLTVFALLLGVYWVIWEASEFLRAER